MSQKFYITSVIRLYWTELLSVKIFLGEGMTALQSCKLDKLLPLPHPHHRPSTRPNTVECQTVVSKVFSVLLNSRGVLSSRINRIINATYVCVPVTYFRIFSEERASYSRFFPKILNYLFHPLFALKFK